MSPPRAERLKDPESAIAIAPPKGAAVSIAELFLKSVGPPEERTRLSV